MRPDGLSLRVTDATHAATEAISYCHNQARCRAGSLRACETAGEGASGPASAYLLCQRQCGLALVGRPGTPGFDCRQRAPSMESQSPSAMRVAPIWPAARRRPPPIRHSSRRKASPSAARSARRGPCGRPWRSARQRLRQNRRHRPCRYPASPESPARLRTRAFRARRIEGRAARSDTAGGANPARQRRGAPGKSRNRQPVEIELI